MTCARRSVAFIGLFDSSRHISLTGRRDGAPGRHLDATVLEEPFQLRGYAERTRSGGRHARRMHGPTFAGRSGGRGAPGASAAVYAEKLAALDGSTGRGARSHGRSGAESAPCTRTRASLRHDHSRRRCNGSAGFVGAAACICVTFEAAGSLAARCLPASPRNAWRNRNRWRRSTGGC